MNSNVFDYEKSITVLLVKYIDDFKMLNNDEKASLLSMCLLYRESLIGLLKIYDFLNSEDKTYTDNDKNIILNEESEKVNVTLKEQCFKCDKDTLRNLITGAADILQEVLPLGTVVELKDEFILRMFKNKTTDEKVNLIITNRFLCKDSEKIFFPYSAVVYPVGEVDEDKKLLFTDAAIKKIVFKGYSDISDLAYITVMKNELILKKGMKSISFASNEEREKLLNNDY